MTLRSYRERFPNSGAGIGEHFARIVADRFHVIRFFNLHFLACWRELNPSGATIYPFK